MIGARSLGAVARVLGVLACLSVGCACAPAPPPTAERPAAAPHAASAEPSVSASATVASVDAPPAGAAPPSPEPVRFLAVGDVMLSRRVAGRIREAGDPELPFRALAPLFASVDFTFGNLEGPFSDHDAFTDTDDPDASVLNVPRANVEGLARHHFALMNLANNHVMDQGVRGVTETRKILAARGIAFTGAGTSLDEAWEPAVVTVRGVRIALVGASFCSVNDHGERRTSTVARIQDEDRLARSLAKARSEADFVIATMHAGNQYDERPTPDETRFAKAALAAGADVVIGAHPHVLQRIDVVNGHFVFYSLGNFVFDHKPIDTRRSVAVRFELSADEGSRGKLRHVEILPVLIDGVTPRLADDHEAEPILERLGQHERTLPLPD
jgi:poly-gamma-glutamate synthesis protein (capsule biosynthesis protein)